MRMAFDFGCSFLVGLRIGESSHFLPRAPKQLHPVLVDSWEISLALVNASALFPVTEAWQYLYHPWLCVMVYTP